MRSSSKNPDALPKKNTWLELAKPPDADRCKECHHRRHFSFHRKPRPKGCNNRKPLSVLKPQYREIKSKLPQNRTKNNAKPHHRKPLRPPQNAISRITRYWTYAIHSDGYQPLKVIWIIQSVNFNFRLVITFLLTCLKIQEPLVTQCRSASGYILTCVTFNLSHCMSTPASTGTTTCKQRPLLLHTSLSRMNK